MSLSAPKDDDERAFWDAAYCAALSGLVETGASDYRSVAEACAAHARQAIEQRRRERGES